MRSLTATISSAVLLVGCGDAQRAKQDQEVIQRLNTEIAALRVELGNVKKLSPPQQPPVQAPKIKAADKETTTDDEPMHPPYGDEADQVAPTPRATEQCWSDYCPCDTSDPDYGGLDITICRNLRMGVEMTPDQFSIGATARDGRRLYRESRSRY